MNEETMAVELTREEAAWLEAAATRGSLDTIVPAAAAQLFALAQKLEWPMEVEET